MRKVSVEPKDNNTVNSTVNSNTNNDVTVKANAAGKKPNANKEVTERHSHLLSAFNESLFDPVKHLYTIDGERYISVTTLIGKYEEEFNEHLIAYNKAGGDTELKNSILKYWNAKKEEASWRGNRIHAYAELAPNLPEPECKQELGVYEWFADNTHLEVVVSELRVYSKKRKIAGTIDLILFDPNTNSYVIVDWKSNMKHLGQYYAGKKMLDVFSDLNANSYNKYRIQQSIYKSILEEAGISVSSIKLVWLREYEDEKPVKRGYKVEELPLSSMSFGNGYIEIELEAVDCSTLDYSRKQE
jgi:ATP-dependent exoDNAse (exonuclease V) beta subunit